MCLVEARLCGSSSSAEGHPMRWGQRLCGRRLAGLGFSSRLRPDIAWSVHAPPYRCCLNVWLSVSPFSTRALAPLPVSIYPDIDIMCHSCSVLVYGSSVGFCVYEDAVQKGIAGIPRVDVMHMHRWHVDTMSTLQSPKHALSQHYYRQGNAIHPCRGQPRSI